MTEPDTIYIHPNDPMGLYVYKHTDGCVAYYRQDIVEQLQHERDEAVQLLGQYIIDEGRQNDRG